MKNLKTLREILEYVRDMGYEKIRIKSTEGDEVIDLNETIKESKVVIREEVRNDEE